MTNFSPSSPTLQQSSSPYEAFFRVRLPVSELDNEPFLPVKALDHPYPIGYNTVMYILEKTNHFDRWFSKLKDIRAKARIAVLLKKVEAGNLGIHRSVGDGISEFKLDYGPGYRLYYKRKGNVIILLINGGTKNSQERDIRRAKEIWNEIEEDHED
jgi:putative addiction module killer protein